MLFNSLEFLVFLVIVFLLYWSLRLRWQNILLVVASYVFYGWWDYRFLALIFISSAVDFFVGKKIEASQNEKIRKLFLALSIFVNLGILGFFKYFNFFVDSAQSILRSFGASEFSLFSLSIILPVGISFYTFQTMSYTIEVFQKKIKANQNFVEFLAFVSFFPQLVAGPIERASRLLPQFSIERRFKVELASDGLRQILWGFFKKIVIADTLASVVGPIYATSGNASGWELLIATFFFAFQIYADFSGYSDIAIGTGRLFGFNLMKNFSYPYFSRNIAEFWKRWHISLSSWFRDYVFIPLGGSKVATKSRYLSNIILVFVLSGLWHGANWTFAVWGLLHGLYYVPYILFPKFLEKNKEKINHESEPKLKDIISITLTFMAVLFSWIFFRATSLHEAILIVNKIFTEFGTLTVDISYLKRFLVIAFLILVEWLQRGKEHPLDIMNLSPITRRVIYAGLILAIIFFGKINYTPFIYFQF